MFRKKILYLFFIYLFSCNSNKKSFINSETEILYDVYYENEEAKNLNNKGIKFSRKGDYQKGYEFFLKSLELEPNNPSTLSNVGLNKKLQKEYNEAIQYFNASYKHSDSTYHIAANNLGLVYYDIYEFNKGIEICSYVIKNTNEKTILTTAYIHRALNYLGNKNCSKAKEDINFLIKNFQDFKYLDYHLKDLNQKLKICLLNETNS